MIKQHKKTKVNGKTIENKKIKNIMLKKAYKVSKKCKKVIICSIKIKQKYIYIAVL